MVPKVAGKGKSFKGAGLYYLHDKKASTAERVVFTHTENLPTDDPARAIRYMAFTAMRQDELKMASGAAKGGRKLKDSVYTYSLSWAPGETPTREDMIAAGRETIKALGLDGHEILMVAHSDEAHPHLHLIVNRVHPETGLAAKLSEDYLALSKWAEDYERRRGKIHCDERVKNNAERRDRKAKKISGFVKHQATAAADYRRWLRAREALERPLALDPNISDWHRQQRQALYDAKEKRVAQRLAQLREQNRSKWAFMFRQQKAEARELDETRKSRWKALLYFLRHRQELKPGGLVWIFQGLTGYHGADFWDEMRKRHEADRKAVSARVSEQRGEIFAQEKDQYQTALEMLKHDQAAERRTMREEHDRAATRPPRERKPREQAAEKEQTEKTVSEEFESRVRKRAKRIGKRDEQRRGKGQGRERED